MSILCLKTVATIAMMLDHIAEFFPMSPVVFRWIGRIAAPIFIFCAAESWQHTSSKTKYLLRLYFAAVAMAVAQFAFDLDNNFFRQLFCMCCLFGLIEIIQANITKGWRCCLVYVLWQVAAYFICAFLVNLCAVPEEICERIITAMLGSVLFLEGGLVYTVLGVVIFLANKSKKKLMVAFACFSLVFFALNSTGLIPWGLGTVTMLEWRLYGRSVIGNIAETMLTILGLHPMEVGGPSFMRAINGCCFLHGRSYIGITESGGVILKGSSISFIRST